MVTHACHYSIGEVEAEGSDFGVTLGHKPSVWGAELHDALCKNKTSVLTIVSLLSPQAMVDVYSELLSHFRPAE